MTRYVCTVCGYVYDEANGSPDTGVAPGTLWAAVPEAWVCPLCGAAKAEFAPQGAQLAPAATAQPVATPVHSELKALAALEMSAVCSNLARGCQKQYLAQQAEWFTALAAYFQTVAGAGAGEGHPALLALAQKELDGGIPQAVAVAKEKGDRGAQRALVWNEKVTRIHKSLLARYAKEGDAMLEGVNAYVCGACGFIYLGDAPPALCPVCKVPSWKFEKVEGRQSA